ncbi:tetratricopeptide repeat protein [Striga asiatica]|uniref:Tetratricopeptide repeat protein n=1 Tax=Striga asiatica TaxID=4170 RepID=A0A5A7QAC9_STRAF|nr:tetratricopeptide repeat protein [Striga asiatica]
MHSFERESEWSSEMGSTETDVENERVRDSVDGQKLVKEQPLSGSGSSSQKTSSERKNALSYANILRSRNKFVDAIAVYESVLERDGENVEAHIDEGRLVEAAEMYQKALTADPSYKLAAECFAIVLTDLGTSLKLAGNPQEGIQKYYEAIKIDPHYAPAYYDLGVVYSEMMQYDTALDFYEKAVVERPMYAEAYCNMGVINKNRGDLESALACYDRCLTVSPNFEIAKNNMAIALTDLGTKVKLEGDINQGVAYYKKALCYNWHYADAMYNLGVAYGEMLNFDMMALSIKPNFSQSLNNLGVVYTVQGKMDAAASMIEKAIAANPTYAEAYNNLGVLYRDAGNISLAVEAYEQCLKIDPDSRNASQNRLLALNYINEGADDKLYDAHRDWGRHFMRLFPQYTSWENIKDPERPLVIAYVSPDYFTHSVSYFIEAPIIYHDHASYRVVVYSAVVKGHLWEKKVASMVREDKIDILVELTGHTANNKLGMMACRPAPVQLIVDTVIKIARHGEAGLRRLIPLRRGDLVKGDAMDEIKTYQLQQLLTKLQNYHVPFVPPPTATKFRQLTGNGDGERYMFQFFPFLLLFLFSFLASLLLHQYGNSAYCVTWIGYPNTTGLPAIDYRLTDALADPVDSKQKHVEELVRLPHSFLCYTPSPEAGPFSPPPYLANGFVLLVPSTILLRF